MLIYLDLLGTMAFAISGALHALRHRLDFLGVLILALATGVGGGMLRDVLLGQTPPVALVESHYLWLCLGMGALCFMVPRLMVRTSKLVEFFDAIGLATFAYIGAMRAAQAGLDGIGIVLIGTLTATGGGLIRDMLTEQIPSILQTGFYASSAALGCMVFLLVRDWAISPFSVMLISMMVTLLLRLYTLIYNIHVPKRDLA